MKLLPVALCVFYRQAEVGLEVWVQTREDDGPYHGMLEFPGGKIEAGETPLDGCLREVDEEVGLKIDSREGEFFGTYTNELPNRTILLYVFLFPSYPDLEKKGQWLLIDEVKASERYRGQIPPPNHKIIEDIYLSKVRS